MSPETPLPREVEPPPLGADLVDHITRCVFRPATPVPAEVLFVFGTIRAHWDGVAHAWRTGHFRRLVLAGGYGPGWEAYGLPIACGMRDALLAAGVDAGAIAVQDRSQNTLEDVAFSLTLLGADGAMPSRIAFAAKAHHSGRSHLTLRRFFPDAALLFYPLPSSAGGVVIDPATWSAERSARARVYAEYLRIVAYASRGDIASPDAEPTSTSSSDASPGTPTRNGNP